jgi:hypothetical protein
MDSSSCSVVVLLDLSIIRLLTEEAYGSLELPKVLFLINECPNLQVKAQVKM